MFGQDDKEHQKIGFLLLPEFSLIAFTTSIEPLRTANRLSGKTLYSWQTFSLDGEAVCASNGVVVHTNSSILHHEKVDVLFVCAGLNPEKYINKPLLDYLRKTAYYGTPVGGICTGTLALAKAGLLDNHHCTIHWENVEALLETFPKLKVTATLFEIERNRYTCSGGTAPLDMMLYSISQDHGADLATQTAEGMLHTSIRQPNEYQRMSLEYRTGITHPKLLAAIAFMEAHLETPYSMAELAEAMEISPRHIERLFHDRIGKTPKRYYNELRLKRAQALLQQTSMSIMQVAVTTGYTSASHFTRTYKDYIGHSPREERKRGN